MGLTTKGMIGAKTTRTLEACVGDIQRIHDAAKAERDDVLVICHGGPISEPDDARFILERTRGIVGFYGASSMERLPTEVAITERVREFTRLVCMRLGRILRRTVPSTSQVSQLASGASPVRRWRPGLGSQGWAGAAARA